MKDWNSRIIDELVELKATGMAFGAAWRLAIAEYPAPSVARGVRDRPALFDFALDGSLEMDDETVVEFTRRICDDAWHGRRPELAALRSLEDAESRDALFADPGGMPASTRSAAGVRRTRGAVAA